MVLSSRSCIRNLHDCLLEVTAERTLGNNRERHFLGSQRMLHTWQTWLSEGQVSRSLLLTCWLWEGAERGRISVKNNNLLALAHFYSILSPFGLCKKAWFRFINMWQCLLHLVIRTVNPNAKLKLVVDTFISTVFN